MIMKCCYLWKILAQIQQSVGVNTMSIFQVEVVPVILEPHQNADLLSIVKIYGYTVCVNTVESFHGVIGSCPRGL